MDEFIKITLNPDYRKLENYLQIVSPNMLGWFNSDLIKIRDFDNRFCSIIEQYKLIPSVGDMFYFAGDFKQRIDQLNKGEYFQRFKEHKEFYEQFDKLKEMLFNHNPQSIVIKNQRGGMTITNDWLIYLMQKAIYEIPEPKNRDHAINAKKPDNETFRPLFIKHTKSLYYYLKDEHNFIMNMAAGVVAELLDLLGFDCKGKEFPELEQYILKVWNR